MLNVGGGELLVILLVALVVLGPAKLPEVARQVGTMARELRRISTSFQDELKSALDEPIEQAARERGREAVAAGEQKPSADPEPEESEPDEPEPDEPEPEPEPEVSTAEAAGMYNVAEEPDPDAAAPEEAGADEGDAAGVDTDTDAADDEPA